MLVWGTANPVGLDNSYNGFFLREQDVKEAVQESVGKPVKIEHKGVDVGKVVSAWVNHGKLNMLLELDPSVLEGALIADLVRAGTCRELSLGYNVSMRASARGEDIAGKKSVVEVSLVRKGDRQDCHIHGFTDRRPAKRKK